MAAITTIDNDTELKAEVKEHQVVQDEDRKKVSSLPT